MTERRFTPSLAFLEATGLYALFSLQFLVQSTMMATPIFAWLTLHQFHVPPKEDMPLAVAVALYLPYVIIILFSRFIFRSAYDRLTLSSRLPKLRAAANKIGKYQNHLPLRVAKQIAFSDGQLAPQLREEMIRVLVDLLITDTRDLFQELCCWSDIRVALYVEVEVGLSSDRSKNILERIGTTEFDTNWELSTKFPMGVNGDYQGYCGAAWTTKKAVSGTRLAFGVLRDPRFYSESKVIDRDRSFLCLPITGINKKTGEECVVAVISIDSSRRYDLYLGRVTRSIINSIMRPIRSAMFEYLQLLINTP